MENIKFRFLPIKSRQEILKSRNEALKTKYTNNIIIIISDFLKEKQSKQNFVRLLVVVSKKVSNKAVIRNKIRRQIKEIFRHLSPQKLDKYYDYQIIAKHQILNVSYQNLKNEIENNINTIKNNIYTN